MHPPPKTIPCGPCRSELNILDWYKGADGRRVKIPPSFSLAEVLLSVTEAANLVGIAPGNMTKRLQSHPELRTGRGVTLPTLRKHIKEHPVCDKARRQPAHKTDRTTKLPDAGNAPKQRSSIHDIVSVFVVSKPASRAEILARVRRTVLNMVEQDVDRELANKKCYRCFRDDNGAELFEVSED
jgi:hypothetical protein